jgi:hypothetical protein
MLVLLVLNYFRTCIILHRLPNELTYNIWRSAYNGIVDAKSDWSYPQQR